MVNILSYKNISWLIPFILVTLMFLYIGNLSFILTILIVIGLLFLVALYNDIKIGAITLLIATFTIIPISKYSYFYTRLEIPYGFLIDIIIVLMILIYLIKYKYKYEWYRLNNGIIIAWLIWFFYTLFQIANPGIFSLYAYYLSFRQETFYPVTVIILTVLVYYKYKNFRFVTIIWSILACLGSLKGIGQLVIGLDPVEYAFVFHPDNHTHMLFGQLRVFSFFSDAGTFGASQAQNAVIAAILAIELKNKEKLLHIITFILTITGMAISGTRGALFVIFAGALMYLLIKGKSSLVFVGIIFLGLAFSFLKYTTILQGNYQIRRLRTALDPNDASFQARLRNQETLKLFMANKPVGYGLGTIGDFAKQHAPHTPLSKIPTDSWYVRIWVENGIVGLILYISILLWMLIKGSILIRSVENLELKTRLTAVTSGIAGIIVASYGNEILGQHPISIYSYFCMAFIFLAPQMDKELKTKPQ